MAKAKKIMDKLRDKNESSPVMNLINSDTESSASNNASRGSNHSKVGTFSVNSIRIKKVPFSEMEDSFLKQGALKYVMAKWTSILNDSIYKFHSSRKASTLAVRAKKLFKLNDY